MNTTAELLTPRLQRKRTPALGALKVDLSRCINVRHVVKDRRYMVTYGAVLISTEPDRPQNFCFKLLQICLDQETILTKILRNSAFPTVTTEEESNQTLQLDFKDPHD